MMRFRCRWFRKFGLVAVATTISPIELSRSSSPTIVPSPVAGNIARAASGSGRPPPTPTKSRANSATRSHLMVLEAVGARFFRSQHARAVSRRPWAKPVGRKSGPRGAALLDGPQKLPEGYLDLFAVVEEFAVAPAANG